MARKLIIDGNGTVLKKGSTVIGGITSFSGMPGWSKSEIEDTELSNTSVSTFILGNLKTFGNLAGTIKLDNSDELTSGNTEYTIAFKNGTTLVFWGDLMELGDATVENNNGVVRPFTIKPTNLNASGVETAPVLTIASSTPGSASAPAAAANTPA